MIKAKVIMMPTSLPPGRHCSQVGSERGKNSHTQAATTSTKISCKLKSLLSSGICDG